MRKLIRREEGQTLILVALALIVLFAFVALAIEMGHIYTVRRQMQNAADAGALAGARALCSGATQPEAKATAEAYAKPPHNLAVQADADTTASTVSVVARVPSEQLFFGGFAGVPSTMDIPAAAKAGCSPAKSACGVMPITFQKAFWDQMANKCPDSNNTIFYVFASTGPVDCTTMIPNCDVNLDGVPDVIISDGQRGWLDFGKVPDGYPSECTGCGNVQCLIQYGYAGPVKAGDCLSGKAGIDVAGLMAVNDYLVGQTVRIPIYDYTADSPGVTCNSDGPDGCGNPPSTYHIVKFGCAKVLGYVIAPNTAPPVRLVKMQLHCGECDTECGTAFPGGNPPKPGDTVAVTLMNP